MNAISFALGCILMVSCAMAREFEAAKPIWPRDRELEMNGSYRFVGDFRCGEGTRCALRVASAYPYRAKANGEFVGYGPARAAPGFFRVDEWEVAATNGINHLEIEAYSGACGNFHFPKQTAFLQAELIVDGKVALATGTNLEAFVTERVRKAPRYSLQRMFTEVYRLPGATDAKREELLVQSPKKLLPRGYAYPNFAIDKSYRAISRETVAVDPAAKLNDYNIIFSKKPGFGFYPEAELQANPFYELQRLKTKNRHSVDERGMHTLGDCEGITFEGAVNRAGFVGMSLECAGPCKVYLTFDELLQKDGAVDFIRLYCNNSIELIIEKAGRYEFESFAANAFRYLRTLVVGGEAKVSDPYVRVYESPAVDRATFTCDDLALEKIFVAAKRSLAANAVDCITDCPTRERAGWCGDTFFTGKASAYLTGDCELEKLFLSNWLMTDKFDCPADRVGLLPAVYPVDLKFTPGSFIPNFAMWFVLELEDYVNRSGDKAFANAFRTKVEGVFAFLRKFENSDGLLEKLPGWVFVEWSEANNLVQDVNYPSNMQYALALDAAARMYGITEFSDKARHIRAEVRRQSWNGKWFCDNSVRQADGSLVPSGKCTETCQYYAFFSGVANRQRDASLWLRMVNGEHGELFPANFIFGRCLRMELLSQVGDCKRIFREMRDHFLPMAEKTGTLWEHDKPSASCCHGLASIAAVYLLRDVLGVRKIDRVGRVIDFNPDDSIPLEHCEATIPVSATECATLGWRKEEDGSLKLNSQLPKGWRLRQ